MADTVKTTFNALINDDANLSAEQKDRIITSFDNRNAGQVAKYSYDDATKQLSEVAEQEVRAQLGISSDFNKEYRIIQALQNPTNYLSEKLAHRAEIDDEAMQTFNRTLKQFKQLDMTDDDAIAKAKAAALEVRNRLEQVHTKRFPTDATSTAKRRSERMN